MRLIELDQITAHQPGDDQLRQDGVESPSRRRLLLALGITISSVACSDMGSDIGGSTQETFSNSEDPNPMSSIIHDPVLFLMYSTQDQLPSSAAAVVTSRLTRYAGDIATESLPLTQKEVFLNNIAPVLQNNGITVDELASVSTLRRKGSIGDVYYLANPSGVSYYIRFTPVEESTMVHYATTGQTLQQNYFTNIGLTDVNMFAINMTGPDGNPCIATITQELGTPITTALQEHLLGPTRLHDELIKFYVNDIIPSIRSGYYKVDLNGGGAGNILWDMDEFMTSGTVVFRHIDYAERPVAWYSPEAALNATHTRMERLFQKIRKQNSNFPELPSLENFVADYPEAFAGLNIQDLHQHYPLEIATTNTAGENVRLVVPLRVVDGLEGDDIYHRLHNIAKKVREGERVIDFDGTGNAVRIIDNSIRQSRLARMSEVLLPATKTGLRILGYAATGAEAVSWYMTAKNLMGMVLYDPEFHLNFDEAVGAVNTFQLDQLVTRASAVKRNQLLHKKGNLAEANQLDVSEIFKLADVLSNDDVTSVANALADSDPLPIALFNNSVPENLIYDVLNGNEPQATFWYSAITDTETGNTRLIFYKRDFTSENGYQFPDLESVPRPVLVLLKTDGKWMLDPLTSTLYSNNPWEYTNSRIIFLPRQGKAGIEVSPLPVDNSGFISFETKKIYEK